ncbi:MAG TPA: maleylpyruvate isomerase family mycothiol-dependent enzyme [Frankiaceae bacterium]|nr:maleylpyruvate isomerase family mycothiol-dependent enzyme [Frankiaceae bacterium]
MFPAENDYLAERRAFLATVESLTPEEFETGPTLCAGWAPRDVLGHLLGIDEAVTEYVKAAGQINKANARLVERFRALDRDALLARAREWAEHPALLSRAASYGLLGDLAVHHQDVVRGLGRRRDVPPASARAILREGTIMGAGKLRRYRVEATDTGRKIGRGQVVRGTAEQLGMWLTGRRSVEPELVFAGR